MFALNQFGIVAAEAAATATTFRKFVDFAPATDMRRSHRSAIQLATPDTTPLVGAKRSRSSDDEEAPPQTRTRNRRTDGSFTHSAQC